MRKDEIQQLREDTLKLANSEGKRYEIAVGRGSIWLNEFDFINGRILSYNRDGELVEKYIYLFDHLRNEEEVKAIGKYLDGMTLQPNIMGVEDAGSPACYYYRRTIPELQKIADVPLEYLVSSSLIESYLLRTDVEGNYVGMYFYTTNRKLINKIVSSGYSMLNNIVDGLYVSSRNKIYFSLNHQLKKKRVENLVNKISDCNLEVNHFDYLSILKNNYGSEDKRVRLM
jgi:hypothetical protein